MASAKGTKGANGLALAIETSAATRESADWTPPAGTHGSRSMLVVGLTLILMLLVQGMVAGAAQASTGSISGVAFRDLNRDGVKQAGEEAWAGHRLYLFGSDGSYLGNRVTDSAGRYTFDGLTAGSYRVEYDSSSWSIIRNDWLPTTGTGYRPVLSVSSGTSDANFGWRPITWSTDLSKPISSYAGPEGLRVSSYNDAVTAQQVHQALLQQTVGAEASMVTVRFAWGSTSITSTTVGESNGLYDYFRATVYVSFEAWFDDHDVTLSHEYGHAWSLYHAHMTQQDPTMKSYLKARGLEGDPRLESQYGWNVEELIAEDYRQLLGSATARLGAQANRDIPPASQVAGLEDFFRSTFTSPPVASGGSTEPAPGTGTGGSTDTSGGTTDGGTKKGGGKTGGGGGGGGSCKKC